MPHNHSKIKLNMKHYLFIALAFLFANCTRSRSTTNTTRYFIPGVYTTWEESKFCSTWDTEKIVKAPHQRNTYFITRHSEFQRNLNEIYFPVEREVITWSAIYDESSHFLNGNKNYPDIQIYPEQNAL